MTIDEKIIETEDAVCISNNAGRILTANSHFCKLFGFDQSEVKWHYLCDLYRNKNELSHLISITEQGDVLQTKMRCRSGRSFPCILTRKATKSMEGIPLLVHSIQRIAM
jgi:PAS domain S-box-containing protein